MASWFEKRRIRRRKRERMEEIIAWMVVPALVVGMLWAGLEVKRQISGTPLMGLLTGAQSKDP